MKFISTSTKKPGRLFSLGFFCFLLLSVQAFAASQTLASHRRATSSRHKTAVWIDTDPSMSPGGHELDDGLALLQAFHSKVLEIRGISVVFGNAPLKTAYPIGREFVQRFGPKGIVVHPGAASAQQLGEETEASRAMAAALQKEKLTLLAIGPLTNVGTVLKNHPEMSSQIDAVIAVAGRRPGQHFSYGTPGAKPFQDFNFEMDPEAFRVLLGATVPVVLAPWEVSSKVWLTAADVEKFRSGNAATQWLLQPALDWLKLWKDRFGVDGFNPFDTLAVGYAISPSMLQCEDLPVEIRTMPDDVNPEKRADGTVPEKPYLLVSKDLASKRSVWYCSSPSPQFKDDLMQRLLQK